MYFSYYSNALKKFFHPVLSKYANVWLSKSIEKFLGESNIEDIQQLLFYNSESGTSLSKFVEKLCQKLESFVSGVNKQFAFQENEVLYLNHYLFLYQGRQVMKLVIWKWSLVLEFYLTQQLYKISKCCAFETILN